MGSISWESILSGQSALEHWEAGHKQLGSRNGGSGEGLEVAAPHLLYS